MLQYQFFLALLLISSAQAGTPTKVSIHFFEGLAPKDTTSSERFQKEYDGAINTAKILIAPKLERCGYELESKTIFYSATDALEALEKAKTSSSQNVWMIVGPRRSNHYVLLAKGSPETPTVSTMASSKELEVLGNLHLSMAPTNKEMAKVAADEAKSRSKGTSKPSYVSIVSEDCVACLDFAEQFDTSAKKIGLRRTKEFKVTGEAPELSQIVKDASAQKPTFILLPNYSKVAAQAIAAIHKVLPKAFFVGGDGWGDSKFGFVQDAKDLENTTGFTVRGFPSTNQGLKQFDLGRELIASKNSNVQQPGSATALSILKIMDSVSALLCKSKPKSQDEFKKAFTKNSSSAFKAPWGVSIYNLAGGDISYGRSLKVK